MTADAAIEFRAVSYRHPPSRQGRPRDALSEIDCAVREGERVLLTGPSGSGKTTLLRCCNGLIPHARSGILEGDVLVQGQNTRDCAIGDLSATVGMVFQDPDHQIFTADVVSEIAFGPEQLGWPTSRIDRAVREAMRQFRLEHLADRQTTDLSWGERQRLAIASVAVVRPAVLVLDEPFSGLDSASAAALLDLLSVLNRESGTTIILSEHRAQLVASWASRRISLAGGKIVGDSAVTGPMPSVRNDFPPRAGESVRPVREAIITLQGIAFRHGRAKAPVLDGITLTIAAGEVLVLTGPNGSGKSTLLKHLNGLLRPESGSILIDGKAIEDRTVAEIARTVGLVCQHADYQLFGETVAEELAFAPGNIGTSPSEISQRIDRVRRQLDIEHIELQASPLALSVGEKQRVSIASVLTMDTPVLALDEPTLGLDPEAKYRLADLLIALRTEGKAIIVATHDTEFAGTVADRIVRIDCGRIVDDRRISEERVGI
jgi:energy-coupling factor transporter ATP-binding protein EcfA2